jgi:uncharacterized integral membrane protein
MLSRFVSMLIFVPLAIILVALAVANRASVAFTIDAFNPGSASLTWQVPLFALIFTAVAAGLILGSFATWLAQGRHRRAARQGKAEAERLLAQAKQRDVAFKAGKSALTAA